MKKVSIILAALVLFGFNSFASEGSDGLNEKMNIKDQIFEKVDVSKHNVEGTVSVVFEISEEDHIIVHEVRTENAELEAYVRKCLQNSEIESTDFSKGKMFEIELNFYLL